MKTSSAIVRLVLKKNRRNRFGEYPIYVVISFHGRVEKATGVSIQEKYWNSVREEIKGSCPNAPVLNRMLMDVKNKVLEAKNRYEYEGKKYTPQMLMNANVDVYANDSDYWTVCNRLMADRRLKPGSRHLYKFAYQRLVKFMGRNKFLVEELTIGVMKDFGRYLEGTIKECTIKGTFGCIAAVWNYAIERKIVDGSGYPFNEFKYNKKYKECPRDYFLEKSHIVRLRDYFLGKVIERTSPSMWHYREGAEDDLQNRRRDLFGIMWWLLQYKFGGCAPIDIAFLTPDKFKRVTIDGNDYWKVEFKRQKTGVAVKYLAKRDIFAIIAIEHFLMYSNHFAYPIIQWKEGITEKQMIGQSHKYANMAVQAVRRAFTRINDDIARDNAMNHTNEPLVKVEKVVMYSARHSRASNYLYTPGATVSGLASMLGRSPMGITTYIHFLTGDKDVSQFDDECII